MTTQTFETDDLIIHTKNFIAHHDTEPALVFKKFGRLWYYDGICQQETYNNGFHRIWKDNVIRYVSKKNVYELHFDEQGKFHHDSKPAVHIYGFVEIWYQHGQIHRDCDKPAFILTGYRHAFIRTLTKRYKLPLFEVNCKAWYQYGKLHRLNNPAKIAENGIQSYYFQGQFHNNYGPAMIYKNEVLWYRHGRNDQELNIRRKLKRQWDAFQGDKKRVEFIQKIKCKSFHDTVRAICVDEQVPKLPTDILMGIVGFLFLEHDFL